jgi:hypothetical protein
VSILDFGFNSLRYWRMASTNTSLPYRERAPAWRVCRTLLSSVCPWRPRRWSEFGGRRGGWIEWSKQFCWCRIHPSAGSSWKCFWRKFWEIEKLVLLQCDWGRIWTSFWRSHLLCCSLLSHLFFRIEVDWRFVVRIVLLLISRTAMPTRCLLWRVSSLHSLHPCQNGILLMGQAGWGWHRAE